MTRTVSTLLCFLFFLATPAMAAEGFHVIYRCQTQASTATAVKGYVLVTVLNDSGQDVRNVEVWAPQSADPIFPAVPVLVGDVENGHQAEVMNPFNVPKELLPPQENVKNVTWRIRYTDAAGARQSVDVIGRKGI